MYKSETFECRDRLARYCVGDGIDVGFAGDAILPTAIAMDLPMARRRAVVGYQPQHLHGNARHLEWFRDGVLDYVYSSHVLEDFAEDETALVLEEWVRVLKVGGMLVLYLPDQVRFLDFCARTGQTINPDHQVPHFGYAYIHGIMEGRFAGRMRLLYHRDPSVPDKTKRGWYSFEVVYERIA